MRMKIGTKEMLCQDLGESKYSCEKIMLIFRGELSHGRDANSFATVTLTFESERKQLQTSYSDSWVWVKIPISLSYNCCDNSIIVEGGGRWQAKIKKNTHIFYFEDI